jgi:hypothetical protein
MSWSGTPREFITKLEQLKIEHDLIPRRVIEAGSLLVKTNVMSITPSRLSGVGRRGAKIDVRYKTAAWGNHGWQSVIFATGPFQLIERDTRPHIEPRQNSTSRGKKRFVVIPNPSSGEGVYRLVHHPGTRGKHTFERGVEVSIPIVQEMFTKESSGVSHATFGA